MALMCYYCETMTNLEDWIVGTELVCPNCKTSHGNYDDYREFLGDDLQKAIAKIAKVPEQVAKARKEYEQLFLCEECNKDVSECVCMDGPRDSAHDLKRQGDYDYCGDDHYPEEPW